jgi:hypothetical protein
MTAAKSSERNTSVENRYERKIKKCSQNLPSAATLVAW